VPLGTIAALFLRLGCTAFGGPAAHIAMMEEEVVRRRGWMTRAEFLDLVGAVNLIPGPNSTEMAIHIGQRFAGFPGLLVAGACFIGPAAGIVLACAWAYVAYGSLPQAGAVMAGIKPVIIAVVAQAVWGLGRTALKSPAMWAIALASAAAVVVWRAPEIGVLAGAGVVGVLLRGVAQGAEGEEISGPVVGVGLGAGPVGVAGAGAAGAAGGAGVVAGVGAWPLFWIFLKIGSVLFGSGYVLLAFLRSELVTQRGWLTERQLLDAVAVGQFTPGPVFTTATFVGYVLAGGPGALAATVGIFLPAFVFVALSGPLVPRIRRSPAAGAALDGVNAASLALMAVVTVELGRGALVNWWSVLLAAASLVVLIRWKVNTAWLVLAGAAVGGVVWAMA
jgi:chromate transporter